MRFVLVAALVWASSTTFAQERNASQTETPIEARLDLNIASTQELEQLPGIGPARAQAIVDFRTRTLFRKSADLLKIRGIGSKTWAALRPLVCAGKECKNSGSKL